MRSVKWPTPIAAQMGNSGFVLSVSTIMITLVDGQSKAHANLIAGFENAVIYFCSTQLCLCQEGRTTGH
jgi:hypothetical protein